MFELQTAAETYEKTCAAAANLLLDRPGKTPKKTKEKHPSKTSKIKKEIPAKLPPSHDFSLLILPLQKNQFKNHRG